MTSSRFVRLKRNFSSMFWMRAFLTVKFINIVLSIFYISRGLTIPQIFYLSIIWTLANLLFEVPSSYMADVWGRKKTILLAVLLYTLYYIVFIFGHGFIVFAIAIFLYGTSFALLTGTEDALVYDTTRELNLNDRSLSEFGKYYSARHIFKIVVPFIGALLARDLTSTQFELVLILDILMSLGAIIFAYRLTEPHHYVDVQEMEAGIITDAWKLIRKNPMYIRAILNRVIIFIASFILWSFHQAFFVDHGLAILTLGIAWSLGHLFSFIVNRYIDIFKSYGIEKSINLLNIIVVILFGFLCASIFFGASLYISLILFILQSQIEVIRWPLYAQYFNIQTKSFNRATTLSLGNLIKSILDVPLLFIASILIGMGETYIFIFSFVLGVGVLIFLRLSSSFVHPTKIGRQNNLVVVK